MAGGSLKAGQAAPCLCRDVKMSPIIDPTGEGFVKNSIGIRSRLNVETSKAGMQKGDRIKNEKIREKL